MAHIGAQVFAAFDDRYVNMFIGPNAQKHTLDDFNADNYDHGSLGFIRGANISVATANYDGGPIGAAMGMERRPASSAGAQAIATSSPNISRVTPRSTRRPTTCRMRIT